MQHDTKSDIVLLNTIAKFVVLPFLLISIFTILFGIFYTVTIQFTQRDGWDGKGDTSKATFVCSHVSRNHPYSKCSFTEVIVNFFQQAPYAVMFIVIVFIKLPSLDWRIAVLYSLCLPLFFFLIYRWEKRNMQKKQENTTF